MLIAYPILTGNNTSKKEQQGSKSGLHLCNSTQQGTTHGLIVSKQLQKNTTRLYYINNVRRAHRLYVQSSTYTNVQSSQELGLGPFVGELSAKKQIGRNLPDLGRAQE